MQNSAFIVAGDTTFRQVDSKLLLLFLMSFSFTFYHISKLCWTGLSGDTQKHPLQRSSNTVFHKLKFSVLCKTTFTSSWVIMASSQPPLPHASPSSGFQSAGSAKAAHQDNDGYTRRRLNKPTT